MKRWLEMAVKRWHYRSNARDVGRSQEIDVIYLTAE